MNGQLAVEVCDTDLNCCDAGELDSDRDDFNHGHVDVFFGNGIRDCKDFEMAPGNAIMIVTHNGIDAWKGDWIRCLYYHLLAYKYLQMPPLPTRCPKKVLLQKKLSSLLKKRFFLDTLYNKCKDRK